MNYVNSIFNQQNIIKNNTLKSLINPPESIETIKNILQKLSDFRNFWNYKIDSEIFYDIIKKNQPDFIIIEIADRHLCT